MRKGQSNHALYMIFTSFSQYAIVYPYILLQQGFAALMSNPFLSSAFSSHVTTKPPTLFDSYSVHSPGIAITHCPARPPCLVTFSCSFALLPTTYTTPNRLASLFACKRWYARTWQAAASFSRSTLKAGLRTLSLSPAPGAWARTLSKAMLIPTSSTSSSQR